MSIVFTYKAALIDPINKMHAKRQKREADLTSDQIGKSGLLTGNPEGFSS